MRFGERLKFELEKREIKQKDFAKRINVSASTLCGYINTNRQPDFELVKKIAAELDVSVDYLLDHERSPERITLSLEERELIGCLRVLGKEKRDMIFRLAKMLNDP